MKPQLCKEIDEATVLELVENSAWVAQQKADGKRVLVSIDDGKLTAFGRNGNVVDIPSDIGRTLIKTLRSGHFVLDGELIKDQGFIVFDLPVAGTLIDCSTPYSTRQEALINLAEITGFATGRIQLLKVAVGHPNKVDLIRSLAERGAEGVVFRRLGAPYEPGKRSEGVLKFKFCHDADVVVVEKGRDGKDNLVVGLYNDQGELVEVGCVTALAGDGPRAKVGDVLCVKYLYSSSDGRLVQPTYPIIRTDKAPEECLMSQLIPADRTIL